MIAAPHATLPTSATELECEASGFLDLLTSLSEVRLVLRAGAFTLFRRTRFGSFRPLRPGLWQEDHSGLYLDPDRIRRICFLKGSTPGAFELAFDDAGFALSILVGGTARDLAAVRAYVADHRSREVSYDSVRQEGAAAWLDEGLSHPHQGSERVWHNRLVHDRIGGTVAVALRSGFLGITSRFLPRFIDRDGAILRVSDASGLHVLHFRSEAAPESFPSPGNPLSSPRLTHPR